MQSMWEPRYPKREAMFKIRHKVEADIKAIWVFSSNLWLFPLFFNKLRPRESNAKFGNTVLNLRYLHV